MRYLGLDIGGANLKGADGHGLCLARHFPLWKTPEKLPLAIQQMLAEAGSIDSLAVTMTGELADCFRNKQEGVERILDAIQEAAPDKPTWVYLTDGRFVSPQQARQEPLLAAASNWRGLATFAARYTEGKTSILFDIGSTTCDIIPLVDFLPAATGRTDTERMILGELVYTGVTRSPLCAVVPWIPWRAQVCPLAQELFATSLDAYLMLGYLPEDTTNLNTADGRPATKEFAWERLARAICSDRSMFDIEDAMTAAQTVRKAQQKMIAEAARKVIQRLPKPPHQVILSGQGEFLGRLVLEALYWQVEILSLEEKLGPKISQVAPAHAMAVLAGEAGLK